MKKYDDNDFDILFSENNKPYQDEEDEYDDIDEGAIKFVKRPNYMARKDSLE